MSYLSYSLFWITFSKEMGRKLHYGNACRIFSFPFAFNRAIRTLSTFPMVTLSQSFSTLTFWTSYNSLWWGLSRTLWDIYHSLSFIYQMLLASPCTLLWQPRVSLDFAKCLFGGKNHSWLSITALNWFFTYIYRWRTV